MEDGWVKLYRSILTDDMWTSEPFSRGQAWVDLILIANRNDKVIRRRGIKINIHRGQVGFSQETLAERWGWSKNKVRRFLNELEDDKKIERKTELKNVAVSTLITLVNYDKFQGNGTVNGTVKDTVNETINGTGTRSKQEETIPYGEILGALNNILGKRFKLTDAFRRLVHARWEEGFRCNDFEHVFKVKLQQWGDDSKMKVYLRPDTLLSNKFNSYRQQEIIPEKTPEDISFERGMKYY